MAACAPQIFLIVFISTTVAQQEHSQGSARTPQAQIKYRDPNGLKVNWKFYARQNQWRSHLQNSQQAPQEEASRLRQSILNQNQPQSQLLQAAGLLHQTSFPQHQEPQEPQGPEPDPNQIQYQQIAEPQIQYRAYPQAQVQDQPGPDLNQIRYHGYPEVPPQDKQLLPENLKPQQQALQEYSQQSDNLERSRYQQSSEEEDQIEEQKSRRHYADGAGQQGKIVYKEEYEQLGQQEPQTEHIPVPVEKMPEQPPQKLVLDKSMPSEIQELLQYQARIPYNVIANSITYKPKTLFVPKPLPSETNGPYRYRSKIYYVNNDESQPDFETTKPIEEEQRH